MQMAPALQVQILYLAPLPLMVVVAVQVVGREILAPD